ncbi:hypothetical protein quinque_015079 [Culex quinquefasciatus]
MDRFGVVLLALVGATALFQTAQAIMFGLEPNTQKCLKDDMQGNQIVAGEYEVTGAPGQKINYVVRDSKGHIMSQKEDISKGKFTFTSEMYDTFEICFISQVPPTHRGVNQEVSLDIKKGIETKSYEGVTPSACPDTIECWPRRGHTCPAYRCWFTNCTVAPNADAGDIERPPKRWPSWAICSSAPRTSRTQPSGSMRAAKIRPRSCLKAGGWRTLADYVVAGARAGLCGDLSEGDVRAAECAAAAWGRRRTKYHELATNNAVQDEEEEGANRTADFRGPSEDARYVYVEKVGSYEKRILRGIRLRDLDAYQPGSSAAFRCLSSTRHVSWARVNDDYCDCPEDGSDEPGTGACDRGRFYCRFQKRHATGRGGYTSVPSGWANDGVCDCCDGSDEWLSGADCRNTCKERFPY